MNEKSKQNNDMTPELFISSKQNTEYCIPPKSKADYLQDLNSEISVDKKIESLSAIIEIYRIGTVNNGGKYSEVAGNEILSLLQNYGLQVGLSERVACMLMREGAYCEKIGDYQNALRFYEGCLPFEIKDQLIRYLRLNNLAFCLNFFMRFEDAEKYLREAVRILPERYNAWKNLGVCLEHQCQLEEAAECYLKAIILSKGEGRSMMHLKRLIDRYPLLKKIPALADFDQLLQA